MSNLKPRFTEEFKAQAVRRVRDSGRPLSEVATEMRVSRQSLALWLRQADLEESLKDKLTLSERERLAFLEQENKVLKEEREILKKASAFFAMEAVKQQTNGEVLVGVDHNHRNPQNLQPQEIHQG